MATNTSSKTANYSLSQYAAGDLAKFLTNYNSDMLAVDNALKAIKDESDAAVPNTRKIAGLAMSADITLTQLISAGLVGNVVEQLYLTLLNGWSASWGNIVATRFGRIVMVHFGGNFTGGASGSVIANLPDGWNPSNATTFLPYQENPAAIRIVGQQIQIYSTGINMATVTAVL